MIALLILGDSTAPRWLFSVGRVAEGQQVTAALNGTPFNSEETVLQVDIINASIRRSAKFGTAKKRDMLTGGPTQVRPFPLAASRQWSRFLGTVADSVAPPLQHLRRVCLGASSQFMQQISGANAIVRRPLSFTFVPILTRSRPADLLCARYLRAEPRFASTIVPHCTSFASAALHITHRTSCSFLSSLRAGRLPFHFADIRYLQLGGTTVTCYAFGSILSFYTVERVGRRIMFLVGSVFQAIAMLIVFGSLLPGTASAANGAVFGIFLYLFTFGSTWLQVRCSLLPTTEFSLTTYSAAPLVVPRRDQPSPNSNQRQRCFHDDQLGVRRILLSFSNSTDFSFSTDGTLLSSN